MIGTSGNLATTLSSIIDGPSVALLDSFQSSDVLINNNTGYRLWSAQPTQSDFSTNIVVPPILLNGTTSYLTIPYDNNWSILSDPSGLYDLQVANGSFQTYGSSRNVSPITGYINYTSYYYTSANKNSYDYNYC